MSRVRPEVRIHAGRLLRYIKDPSTIRSMLTYEFGLDEPLPSKSQINGMKPHRSSRGRQIERGIT